MPVAFRYSGRKYNDSLLALGNVRIGTLHDFRKTEHKQGISDANEGIKVVSHHIPFATEKDAGGIHMNALKQFNFAGSDGFENITVQNVSFARRFDHPNCFVHCASETFSSEVLQQFEGADSCVEITDVINFYDRLTSTLDALIPVRLVELASVKYMKRYEDWNGRNWGVHPALIKEPNFIKQVEVRAIWAPMYEGPINPIVLNDIGLIKYCREKKLSKKWLRSSIRS